MTAEEWRPIEGSPGYEVSSLGRVASTRGGGRRILSPWTNPENGYLYVALGRQRKTTVHSLVAETFCGPRREGQVVRHLDGSRQNNVASNLLLGSPSENNYDSVQHGTHGMVRRTHCPSGHEYTAENTRLYQGRRFCIACKENRTIEARRQRGQLLIVGRDPLRPCPQGHERTPENTYVWRGRWTCRACARERRALWSARAAGISTAA